MPSAPAFLSARAMRRLDVGLAIWAVLLDRDRRLHRVRGGGAADAQPHRRQGGSRDRVDGARARGGRAHPVRRRSDPAARRAGDRRRRERACERSLDRRDRRPARRPPRDRDRAHPDRATARSLRAASLGWRRNRKAISRPSRAGTARSGSRRSSHGGPCATCGSTSSGRSATTGRRGPLPNSELAAAELRRLGLDRPARRVVALRRPQEPVPGDRSEAAPPGGRAARGRTARAAAGRTPLSRLRRRRRLAGAAARRVVAAGRTARTATCPRSRRRRRRRATRCCRAPAAFAVERKSAAAVRRTRRDAVRGRAARPERALRARAAGEPREGARRRQVKVPAAPRRQGGSDR